MELPSVAAVLIGLFLDTFLWILFSNPPKISKSLKRSPKFAEPAHI